MTNIQWERNHVPDGALPIYDVDLIDPKVIVWDFEKDEIKHLKGDIARILVNIGTVKDEAHRTKILTTFDKYVEQQVKKWGRLYGANPYFDLCGGDGVGGGG